MADPPPTTELLDLLGRRWALRILWELREAPRPFGDLQERCDGMSTSVLTQRLAELRDAGLIEPGDGGYALTDVGGRLLQRLSFFDEWAREWARQWTGGTRGRSGPSGRG